MLKKILRYAGIVIGIMLGVGIYILLFSSKNEYSPEYSFSSPAQYTDLFNDSAKHKLVLYVTNQIKGRLPISEYVYDDRLSIIVYKLNVSVNSTLDSLIHRDVDNSGLNFGKRFCTLDIGQFKLSYACDSVDLINRVFLTFYGDSAKIIYKTNSVLCIKALINNLVIRYRKSKPPDIQVEKRRPNSQKIPIELAFAKQNSSLYFILISPIINSQIDYGKYTQLVLNSQFFS